MFSRYPPKSRNTFLMFTLIFFLICILRSCSSASNKINLVSPVAQETPFNVQQSISFTLNPPEGCVSTPSVAQAQGARYFYIECVPSIKRVKIQFKPSDVQGIYDYRGKAIKYLNADPSTDLKIHIIEVCNETGKAKEFCSKIRFAFRIKSNDIPLLDSQYGLVFSDVASRTRKAFNPKAFVYNVTLKSVEPVIITARSGRKDWFVEFEKPSTYGDFNSFTEGIKHLEFKPQKRSTKHQELMIFVADIQQKLITNYTIGINIVDSTDTTLQSVEVTPGKITPAFDRNVFAYTYVIPQGADKFQLKLKPTDFVETRCFAQFSTVFMDSEVISWLKKKPVETKGQMPTPPKTLIPVDPSGIVVMSVPDKAPSSNAIVHCSKLSAPEQNTRYIFTVIQSKATTVETTISDLKIPGFVLDQPIVSGSTGPYVLRENVVTDNKHSQNKTEALQKWINFKSLVPTEKTGAETTYIINGEPLNEKEFALKYFYVPKGERETFRIEVVQGLVRQEYVIIIDKRTKWQLDTRVSRQVGSYLGWLSTVASVIDSSLFLSNSKFLQFLAITHWFHNAPEIFKSFTEPFLAMNFQKSYSKSSGGVSTMSLKHSNAPSTTKEKSNISATVNQTATRSLLVKQSLDKPTAAGKKVSFFSKSSPTTTENPTAVDYLLEQREQVAACCHSLICLMLVFIVAGIGYTIIFKWNISQYSNQESTEPEKTINKELQSIIPFYVPFVFEPVKPMYLSILHPSRFWNCLYDFMFISALHSCFSLLCLNKQVSRIPVHVFGLIWVTPSYLALFAIIMLVIGPGLYFTVGTLLIKYLSNQLVYSSVFQRYHDKSVQKIKAIYKKWSWIPIVSDLTAIEIVPVALCESYSESPFKYGADEAMHGVISWDAPVFGPECSVHFKEDQLPYTPWLVGKPSKLHAMFNKTEAPVNASSENYHILEPLDEKNVESFLDKYNDHAYCAETDEMQMNLTLDNVTLNHTYMKKYADAHVGSAHCSILNAYDIPLELKLSVCLTDIPAICSLRTYPLWIKYKNLQKDIADCWSQLFNSSHNGYIFQWTLEHIAIAQMIFTFAAFNDPTGLLAVGLWLSASLLIVAVSFPSICASATSKWSAHMKKLHSQKTKEQAEIAEHAALKNFSWPFNDPRVQELFALITEHQTMNHALTRLWHKVFVGGWTYLTHHEFWSTRLRFFITELLVSQYVEIGKATVLILLFLSSSKITNESSIINQVASLLLICSTVFFLTCIHSVMFSYWKEQMASFYIAVSTFLHTLCIVFWDLANNALFRSEKLHYYETLLFCKLARVSKALLSQLNCVLHLLNLNTIIEEKILSVGETKEEKSSSLLFTGEKVLLFKVNEVTLLNNELGIHLHGSCEPKKKQRLKMRASGVSERCDIYKELHVFAPLVLDKRLEFCYQTMPLQISYAQFLHASSNSESTDKSQRCVGTLHVINSFSETEQGSFENDSFLSLYAEKQLLPEYGKVYLKEKGHGYVVQWIASTKSITIRGPEIRAGREYSVTSVVSGSNDFSLKNKQVERTIVREAKCVFSGRLCLSLLEGERPNLNKPLQIFNSQEMLYFSVDPNVTKVEYCEYEIGNSMRYELTILSKQLRSSLYPYCVEWTSTAEQHPISASVKSTTDGTLVISWNSNKEPDMVSPILLKEKSKKKGAAQKSIFTTSPGCLSILIDPLETDAHQLYFNPIVDQQSKKLFGSCIPKIENAISGLNVYQSNYLPLPPIPCTIVQCVHPNEKQFRVEPNFNQAVLSLEAKIEEYQAILEYELNKRNTNEKLLRVWPQLISIGEFIEFWAKKNYDLTRDNAWGDMNSLQSTLIDDGKTEYLDLFREKLEERVQSHISYLLFLKKQYALWAFAYSDSDMYAALLRRDSEEWLPYKYGGVSFSKVSSLSQTKSDSELQDLAVFKATYQAKTPQFQYPMTVNQKQLSLRTKTNAQCQVWREEIVAWLAFSEDIYVSDSYCLDHGISKPSKPTKKSNSMEKYTATSTEIIIESFIRSIERSIHCIENPAQHIYRPMVHYVVLSTLLKTQTQLEAFSKATWNPLPLAAHPCKVRLFRGDAEDGQYVNWKQPVWVNCFIKLTNNKVILLFPHENDPTLEPPNNFTENDLSKRFSWNQIQAYYIPLKCFDNLAVTKISEDGPPQPEELAQLLSKLVLQKSTQNVVDDDYVRTLYDDGFSDDVVYQGNILKLRLCNSVPSSSRKYYSTEDTLHLASSSQVLPLTLRFYDKFQERWEKAINEAKLHTPCEPDPDFDGVLPSDVREETRSARRLGRRYSNLAVRHKMSKDQHKEVTLTSDDSDCFKGSMHRAILPRYADQNVLPHDVVIHMVRQQGDLEISRQYSIVEAPAEVDTQVPRVESFDSQKTYSTESSVYVDVVALQRDAMSGTLTDVFKSAVSTNLKHTSSSGVYSTRYVGELENMRFKGGDGTLYDKETGEAVYSGEWVDGCRWGMGEARFNDVDNFKWHYEGEFVADELRHGKLSLLNQDELKSLLQTSKQDPSANRYRVVEYQGLFFLPETVVNQASAAPKRKVSISHEKEPLAYSNPRYLKALLQTNTDRTTNVDDIIIDIPRAISASADNATLKASLQLAHQLMHQEKLDERGVRELLKDQPAAVSQLVQDTSLALEQYLPHYTKWISLLSPEKSGFETIQDRFSAGRVMFADGTSYYGELRNGIPEGLGLLHDPTTEIMFHGYLREGMPHGYGMGAIGAKNCDASVANAVYYGGYRNGLRDGPGVQVSEHRSVQIRGVYSEDKLNGEDCYVHVADPSCLTNDFVRGYKTYTGGVFNNRFDGSGALEWRDGHTFKGKFTNGERAEGQMFDPDGKLIYSGEWLDDLPHGRAVAYCSKDGYLYCGEVNHGKPEGVGELFYKGEIVYEGIWLKGKPHGRGTLYAAEGIYEGEFVDGSRSGKGRFEFKSENVTSIPIFYEGNWKHNVPHGYGVFSEESKNVFPVTYENGVLTSSAIESLKQVKYHNLQPAEIKKQFKIPETKVGLQLFHQPILEEKLDVDVQESINGLGEGLWHEYLHKDLTFMEKEVAQEKRQPFDEHIETCELEKVPKFSLHADEITQPKSPDEDDKSLKERIEILIEKAEDLLPTSSTRPLHPYCRVRLGRRMKRTKPINAGGASPKWNNVLYFEKEPGWAQFEVYDKQPLGADNFVGSGEYNLSDFVIGEENCVKVCIDLSKRGKKAETISAGKLYATIKIVKGSFDEPTQKEDKSTARSTKIFKKDSYHTCTVNIKSLVLNNLPEESEIYFVLNLEDHVETTGVFSYVQPIPMILSITSSLPMFERKKSIALRVEIWLKQELGDEVLGFQLVEFKDQEFSDKITLMKFSTEMKRDIPVGTVNLVVNVN